MKYQAILNRAERVVEQWEKYDRHKAVETERDLGEPDEVAMARELIRLDAAIRLAEVQYMGCGGNLRPDEVVSSMRSILREAVGLSEPGGE